MKNPEWHKPRPKRLPQPSYAPPLLALGLTCALGGVVTSWMVSAIGLAITGAAAALWIGDFGVGEALAANRPEKRRKGMRAAKTKHAPKAAAAPWLHRTAMALAAFTLALIVLGAGVTSKAGSAWETSHIVTGSAVGVLTLVLALLLRNAAGWVLLAAVVLQAALGNRGPAVAAFHAFLAHLFFAATVALALVTSRTWEREPEIATDMARPPLGTLAWITVGVATLQVALGAAVRHKVMGAGLHITFALVVALMIVVLGVLVTNQYPTHRTLRPAAIAMMVIAGAQVFLGFGAFIVRMMADENTLPVQIATMAHVTTGALTLASTVVLTLLLQRHLRPSAGKTQAP